MKKYTYEEKMRKKKKKIILCVILGIIILSIIGVGIYEVSNFMQEKSIDNMLKDVEHQLNN